jgi:Predicted transporter component
MGLIIAALSGSLFGVGLLISGMLNPAKVIGFLDITRSWDPSLAFVMGGGLLVSLVGVLLVRNRSHALDGQAISLPDGTSIDMKLVLGAALFGVGWGLAGICPGPAMAGLGSLMVEFFIFMPILIVGLLTGRYLRSVL